MNLGKWRLCLAAILIVISSGLALAEDQLPEAQITALMAGMFDRPDSKLKVDPIVVVSNHAIAGWSQGDMGGRALLRRNDHGWQLVLCSGDQLRSADNLTKMGLPPDVAKSLAAKLSEQEGKVAADRLALFAKFDGIVMMDQQGNHPPGHAAPHAPAHTGH